MIQDDRAVACSRREVELDAQVRVHVNVGFHRIRRMNPNHVLLLE